MVRLHHRVYLLQLGIKLEQQEQEQDLSPPLCNPGKGSNSSKSCARSRLGKLFKVLPKVVGVVVLFMLDWNSVFVVALVVTK